MKSTFLAWCSAPFLLLASTFLVGAVAAETVLLECTRVEHDFTEVYRMRISADNGGRGAKGKVFLDDRDLDQLDEKGGRQVVKNISISGEKISFLIDTNFPPESFDGVQYGAGSVITVITINRATGQLRKAETVKGGILSATLGEGSKTYQEQCTAAKKP